MTKLAGGPETACVRSSRNARVKYGLSYTVRCFVLRFVPCVCENETLMQYFHDTFIVFIYILFIAVTEEEC